MNEKLSQLTKSILHLVTEFHIDDLLYPDNCQLRDYLVVINIYCRS